MPRPKFKTKKNKQSAIKTNTPPTALKRVQQDADEVINIMGENIQKNIDKLGSLENLQLKTEKLEIESKQFKKTSKAVKKNIVKNASLNFIPKICFGLLMLLAAGLSGNLALNSIKDEKTAEVVAIICFSVLSILGIIPIISAIAQRCFGYEMPNFFKSSKNKDESYLPKAGLSLIKQIV